jgi:hypothetical protein
MHKQPKTVITEREYAIYLLGYGDGSKRLKVKKQADIAASFAAKAVNPILRDSFTR